jgi:hypothetical protein
MLHSDMLNCNRSIAEIHILAQTWNPGNREFSEIQLIDIREFG